MGLSYSYDDEMLRIVGEGDYTALELKDLLLAGDLGSTHEALECRP